MGVPNEICIVTRENLAARARLHALKTIHDSDRVYMRPWPRNGWSLDEINTLKNTSEFWLAPEHDSLCRVYFVKRRETPGKPQVLFFLDDPSIWCHALVHLAPNARTRILPALRLFPLDSWLPPPCAMNDLALIKGYWSVFHAAKNCQDDVLARSLASFLKELDEPTFDTFRFWENSDNWTRWNSRDLDKNLASSVSTQHRLRCKLLAIVKNWKTKRPRKALIGFREWAACFLEGSER